MACGRLPYRIHTEEKCFPHEVPPCPPGYKEVRIDAVRGPTTAIPYCFGDVENVSYVNRHKRLCEKDSWSPSRAQQIACCTGAYDESSPITASFICPPDMCFGSRSCDDVMRAYCKTEQGKNQGVCGCLLPAEEYTKTKLIGPPECVDSRCAQNPRAYKTQEQQANECKIVNCIFDDIDFNIEDSNISGDLLRQFCGNEAVDELLARTKGNNNDSAMGGIIQGIQNYIRSFEGASFWVLVAVLAILIILSLSTAIWIITTKFVRRQ